MTTIVDIKEMLARKIVFLNQLKTSAENVGDIDRSESLDIDIAQTQTTLDLLNTLPG